MFHFPSSLHEFYLSLQFFKFLLFIPLGLIAIAITHLIHSYGDEIIIFRASFTSGRSFLTFFVGAQF